MTENELLDCPCTVCMLILANQSRLTEQALPTGADQNSIGSTSKTVTACAIQSLEYECRTEYADDRCLDATVKIYRKDGHRKVTEQVV